MTDNSAWIRAEELGRQHHRAGRTRRVVLDRLACWMIAALIDIYRVIQRVITRSAGGRAGGLKPLVPVSVELA
jgi:hypothetical protein